MPELVLENFNLGGISDSRYAGLGNSAFKIEGFNLHEEPGILKSQQAIQEDGDSDSFVFGKVRSIVVLNDNKSYFFDESGDIHSRDSSGTYTLEATVAPAAGADKILDAKQYGDFVYYSMPQRLGRWTIGSAWGTRNDNYQILDFDDEFHPLIVIENRMYVGNASNVALVDDRTLAPVAFDAAALILEPKYTIQTLGKLSDKLIIGTITEGTTAGSFSGFSAVFNWDRISIDLTSEATVPEFGVNAFIDFNGSMLIQAGKKGNLYSYNGVSAVPSRRIPGDWGINKEGIVENNSVSSYLGIPIFGFANQSVDPANNSPMKVGVYSFGGFDAKYPRSFNLEYLNDSTNDRSVSAVARIGQDLIFSVKSASVAQIFSVDLTNKHDASFLETQVINLEQGRWKNFRIKVTYRKELTNDDDILIQYQTNESGNYANLDTRNHSNMAYIESNVQLIEANSVQFKIITNATDNTAPEIEKIIINFD